MKIFNSSLLAVCLLLLVTPLANATTAITNVTVVDARYGAREHMTVVVQDDDIVAVERDGKVPADATVVNGKGKFLIPGLWDFHVHLTFDERLTQTMPAQFLYYGITSVRDTGGLMDKLLPAVAQMRLPNSMAPRVFFAGPLLDGGTVVYDGESAPEIGIQNVSPKDARDHIAQLKTRGVDFIKIYELVSPQVFVAMVEAANELQLPVDSHVPLSMRASVAGPSLDSLEHLRNVELDCAANTVELHQQRLVMLENPEQKSGYALRGSIHKAQRTQAMDNYDETVCDATLDALANTVQVPTLRLNAYALSPAHQQDNWSEALALLPPAVATQWQADSVTQQGRMSDAVRRHGEWSMTLIEKMHGKGIPIGAGTDTPIGFAAPGYSLHSELEMLVRAGLSPREALRSATVRPAEFFSLEQRMGTIEKGKAADLVMLENNPLDNISNVRGVLGVMSKGRYYTRDQLRDAVAASR